MVEGHHKILLPAVFKDLNSIRGENWSKLNFVAEFPISISQFLVHLLLIDN